MGYVVTKAGDYLLLTDGASSYSLPLPLVVKNVGETVVAIYAQDGKGLASGQPLFTSPVSGYQTIDGSAALTTAVGIVGQLNALCAEESPAGSSVSWIGNLTQASTAAPAATQLKNNTGATVTWTRVSEGVFRGTASSAIFTANRVTFAVANGTEDKEVTIAHTSTTVITITQKAAGVVDDDITFLSLGIHIWA